MPKSPHPPPVDAARDIKAAFETWNRDNKVLPPTGGSRPIDGQSVIARARNLLPILDIFAEIHPAAKAVISGFKVLIIFESERRDNKARVATVILAQTEMMSTFLEVYALDTQHPNPLSSMSQRSNQKLLDRVQADIEECGNVIDAYYKEPRLVKFLKALDWKDLLLDYIQKFKDHRDKIQTMLSLRTAAAVDGIASKVDTILEHLFTQKEEWEKKLDSKIAFSTKPTKIGRMTTTRSEICSKNTDNMVVLKNTIHSSLAELCRRNSEVFFRKFELQTKQMQDAVAKSAEYIVRELSGPYDRLRNENLRQLWKEMSWAFCVENQQFAQALCEYFVDFFSSPARGAPTLRNDLWTLQYFSTHAREISNAIDSDKSGFIRISEANAFASKTPDGWSLPQWCCYAALGLPYERSIYKNRIHDVIDRMSLEQIRVKPENRAHYARFINGEGIAAISLLARGPPGKLDMSTPWQALAEDRVSQQDKRLHKDLLALKFNIDAAETIHLLCGEAPLEDYILQLATLLLEHYFRVTQLCRSEVLDTLEFRTMWESLEIVREEVDRRIEELKGIFTKRNSSAVNEQLDDHSDGIFRMYHRWAASSTSESPETTPSWDIEEVASRLTAITSNRNFEPLGESPSAMTIKGCLAYEAWEDHIRSLPKRPDRIPLSWNLGTQPSSDMKYFGGATERILDFPIHEETWCDKCHQQPIIRQVCFTCVVCPNLDLCASCYLFSSTEMDMTYHSDTHEMIKHALFLTTAHRAWIVGLARFFLTEFYSPGRLEPAPNPMSGEVGPIAPIPLCHHCERKKGGSVFQCMEIGCGYFQCEGCEKTTSGDPCSPPEPEAIPGGTDIKHQPWHTMLIIHPNIDSGGPWSSRKPSPPSREVTETKLNNTLEGRVTAVEGRLEAMEGRMANMEVTLKEVKTLLMRLGPR
ncbi:hypothetical protein BD779DRAFT_1797749 [Infundibulicybe gibba]|nr:hypothetical protein BD779DRAFT_1797749 [Infundibulicybe gibba]